MMERSANSSLPPTNGAATANASALATAARNGDVNARTAYARTAYTEAGRALGIGLATLVNLLNLPLCLVGGGMAQSWDPLSAPLFGELRRRSYVYRRTMEGGPASCGFPGAGTQVIPARLGPEAGLLGPASFRCKTIEIARRKNAGASATSRSSSPSI